MLSPADRDKIAGQFADLARDQSATPGDYFRFLFGLPADPEAMELVLRLARDHSAAARASLDAAIETLKTRAARPARQTTPAGSTASHAPRPSRTGSSEMGGPSLRSSCPPSPLPAPITTEALVKLLGSPAAYPPKVEALLACVRARDRAPVPAVRKLIAGEQDPYVLATMASFLGHLGVPDDAGLLVGLLRHSDTRVVANALEALYRLKVSAPLATLTALAEAPDNRVRINALALIARDRPEKVLDLIFSFLTSSEPAARGGMAYLLGELSGRPRALDLLLEMLAVEEKTPVLKQIANGLRKHVAARSAPTVLGPLWVMSNQLTGARLAMVNTVIHEIAVESGLVQSQVVAIGQEHLEKGLDAWEGTSRPPDPEPDSTGSARAAPDRTARIDPGEAPAPPDAGAARTTKKLDLAQQLAEGDAELPATFSAVWGASGTSGASTRAIVVPRGHPLFVQRWGWPLAALGSVALIVSVALWSFTGQEPTAVVSLSAQLKNAPSARPSFKIQPAPRPSVAGRSARPAGGTRVGGTRPDEEDPYKVARHLGPTGAYLDVEGEVVSATPGRVVVRCQRRYYLLRGKQFGNLPAGKTMRVRGTVAGVARNGLIYVQVG